MGKVGYSTLTLTDLTETLPVSLVLQTNQDQNIQTKNGNLYTPNFKEEELIITPSLFIGSKEEIVPIGGETGYIYYQIGDINENNKEIDYVYDSSIDINKAEVYVDEQGQLHYKKNLSKNLTIEAYINNFYNIAHGYTIETIHVTNPINILFLEEGTNQYTAVITSNDGREHFEENNSKDIILTATLYKGAEPITSNISYEWDIVTDQDTEEDSDDLDWDNDKEGTDFIATTQSITVSRANISSIEVFRCTFSLEDGSDSTFSATKIIRDFTDGYNNQILANGSLILTPSNTTVTLTNQVWYQANIINGDTITEEEEKRFKYKWSLLTKDAEEIVLIEEVGKNYKNYTIDINKTITTIDKETGKEKIINYPKENFSILGIVTIDGKAVTLNYADIKYQPVTYSINVSPKSIFVPATAAGEYWGSENFIQKIKFQLLDDKKNPLEYNTTDDSPEKGPTLITNDGSSFDIDNIIQEPGLWSFEIPFVLNTSTDNDLWSSANISNKVYEFSYTYLGQDFTEEFEVIKNYAGLDGEQGFSGYTIDLSNNFHAFSGGESVAEAKQETSCQISAYFGDEPKTIDQIIFSNLSSDNILYEQTQSSSKTLIYKNSLMITSTKIQDNVIKITFRTGPDTTSTGDDKLTNFLSDVEALNFLITLGEGDDRKTFLKTFSYTINYNGKSYYLYFPEGNIIKYSEAEQRYTPSTFSVSALYRETTGAANTYEDGKIIYSFDNKNWEYLGNSGIIQGYKNLENIYIRLYSSRAADYISSTIIDLINSEEFLLDMETIPILTSLEGYEIGGENLIKWSKTIPIEPNKWTKFGDKPELFITQDGDFSIMNFNVSDKTENTELNFSTPKISLTEDYLEKKFCFSCLIKIPSGENIQAIDDYFSFIVAGYNTVEESARNCFKTIASFYQNGQGSLETNEDWDTNTWIRVYKVFDLKDFPEENFDSSVGYKNILECKYFNIIFCLNKNGTIQIKQPKLEIGNISTAWSASPYDIDFSNISGINLIQSEINTLDFSPEEIPILLASNLSPSYYTLSWSNIEISSGETANQTAYFKFVSTNSGFEADSKFIFSLSSKPESENFFTFEATELLDCYFYNSYDKINISRLKLEKGTVSTSYSLTDDQIESIVNEIALITNSSSQNVINSLQPLIIDENGNPLYADIDTIETLKEDIANNTTKIASTQEGIEGVKTSLTATQNELQIMKQRFFLGVKDVNNDGEEEPVLILSTEAGYNTNNYMVLTDTALHFYSNNIEVATLSNMSLSITDAVIKKSLKIGGLKFIPSSSGVALIWED